MYALPRLLQRTARQRCFHKPNSSQYSLFSTYYDSQSGKHVPIHNDQEVSAFLSTNEVEWTPDKLESVARKGVAGLLVDSTATKNNTVLLDMLSQDKLQALLPWSFSKEQDIREKLQDNDNMTLLFQYDSQENLAEEISNCMDQKIATAFLCRCDEDALELASGVAQLMDDTGGGKYLYIVGDDSEQIVQVCEELSYLDVAGPTMKSRLIVDLGQTSMDDGEETVEECLLMGVNKFVVPENQLEWLGKLVQEEGKTCTFQIDYS